MRGLGNGILCITKTSAWRTAAAALMLAYPFFGQLAQPKVTLALAALGFAMVIVPTGASVAKKGVSDVGRLGLTPMWVLFGCVAVASAIASGSAPTRPVLFTLYALAGLAVAFDRGYNRALLAVLLFFCGVHALATLVLYLRPDLYYEHVKSVFFPTAIDAVGYQSGLTTHYSYNSMFLSHGVLLSFAWLVGNDELRKDWLFEMMVVPLFFLSALFLTTKRSLLVFAVLSCLVACVPVAMARGSLRLLAMRVFAVIGVMAVLLPFLAAIIPGVSSTLNHFADFANANDAADVTTGRTHLWLYAMRLWQKSPLVGNGWGSFLYEWPGISTVSIGAHNVYLQLLAEGGIVLCALFALLQGESLHSAFTVEKVVFREASGSEAAERMASLFACATEVFFLLYCLVGNPLYDSQEFAVFLLCVGTVEGLAHRKQPEKGTDKPQKSMRTAGIDGTSAMPKHKNER